MPFEDLGRYSQVIEVTCALVRASNESPTGKTALDGGRDYVKSTNELEADGIKICVTACHTPGRMECG